MPEDVDWVWFMGDDDYIPDPKALLNLCNLLSEKTNDPDFGLFMSAKQRDQEIPVK